MTVQIYLRSRTKRLLSVRGTDQRWLGILTRELQAELGGKNEARRILAQVALAQIDSNRPLMLDEPEPLPTEIEGEQVPGWRRNWWSAAGA